MYSKEVIKHFKNPHNMGSINNPDGVGEAGNVRCGDLMKLYIKVENDKIKDVKFETLGCAAAIATSSMMTDLAKGKKIDAALKITNLDVAEALEGLPSIKMHCSNLAANALKAAINDFRLKQKDDKRNKKSRL